VTASLCLLVQELQHVFAHLQLGRKAEYSPRKFAHLLGLDSSEQQDPQVSKCLIRGIDLGCSIEDHVLTIGSDRLIDCMDVGIQSAFHG